MARQTRTPPDPAKARQIAAAERAKAISFSAAFAGDSGKVFGAQLRALLCIEFPLPGGLTETDAVLWSGRKDAYAMIMHEVRKARELLGREERGQDARD